MIFITDIPESVSPFDCLNNDSEYRYEVKNKMELIDYFVTEYPRIDPDAPTLFSFIYGLFDRNPFPFSLNQSDIISIANNLFEGARPLSEFEEKVLGNTFNRLIKKEPTRPNRI
jgi:hypothetical protein